MIIALFFQLFNIIFTKIHLIIIIFQLKYITEILFITEGIMDKYNLNRFIKAQEIMYSTALREIKACHKQSHWIWFVFPQMRGLGISPASYSYGISCLEEAEEYLRHPLLSARLYEVTEELLKYNITNLKDVYKDDAKKIKSCMTLFSIVSGETNSVFHKVLDRFFDGKQDGLTLSILGM